MYTLSDANGTSYAQAHSLLMLQNDVTAGAAGSAGSAGAGGSGGAGWTSTGGVGASVRAPNVIEHASESGAGWKSTGTPTDCR